jgi:D-3-phosphoglycerate dehydrogenase
MSRVVVTDASFPELAAEEAAARAAGADFVRAACRTEAEVAAAVAGARVAVVQFAPFGAEAAAALAPGATVIRYGVGYDNLDLDALAARGVAAAYVPDYCAEEVADHTAAMLLALLRKLPALDASVRAGRWDAAGVARPLRPFAETTVGFLGFGRIAQGVARRLAPFGFRFLAADPAFAPGPDAPPTTPVGLDALLAQSHALSLHAPATPRTAGLIDAAALARLPEGAVLVNTARGELVDAAALAAALASGRLAGAALDVFPAEPLPADAALRAAPNLLMSPHAAWYSDAAAARLQALVADEIARALAGRPPRRPIPRFAP